MTAAIINFPTLLERDENEFRRKGTSSYLRVIDEAEELWGCATGLARAVPASRAEAFARAVDLLAAQRPEVVGDRVALGRGLFELRVLPELFRALAI